MNDSLSAANTAAAGAPVRHFQDAISLSLADGIATLSLSQAARGNPIDGPCCRAFRDAALALWDTPGLRAVHLRAEGANFSFGGDIKAFHPRREQLAGPIREWTADLHTGLQRFWQLPVPVVAEVQGYAMGGAVGVLAGCDLVLAGRSAKLGSAFAQLGFSCDSGSSITLSARMGMARARRFMLMAEVLGSPQAQAAGLVDEVVDDAELAAAALAAVRKLAAGPTVALGEIKRLFLRAGSRLLEAQLDDEALTLARVAGSADAREGICALAERRAPHFQGR